VIDHMPNSIPPTEDWHTLIDHEKYLLLANYRVQQIKLNNNLNKKLYIFMKSVLLFWHHPLI
jgi:hypothetical protein